LFWSAGILPAWWCRCCEGGQDARAPFFAQNFRRLLSAQKFQPNRAFPNAVQAIPPPDLRLFFRLIIRLFSACYPRALEKSRVRSSSGRFPCLSGEITGEMRPAATFRLPTRAQAQPLPRRTGCGDNGRHDRHLFVHDVFLWTLTPFRFQSQPGESFFERAGSDPPGEACGQIVDELPEAPG
jgi:hypothetical protein